MKTKPYHVSPAVQKWEEENYKRLMERKVKGARSTITGRTQHRPANPTGHQASPTRSRGNSTTGCTPTTSSRPSDSGGGGGPRLASSNPAAGTAQELDTRLQQLLGLPLMQQLLAAKQQPQSQLPSLLPSRRPSDARDGHGVPTDLSQAAADLQHAAAQQLKQQKQYGIGSLTPYPRRSSSDTTDTARDAVRTTAAAAAVVGGAAAKASSKAPASGGPSSKKSTGAAAAPKPAKRKPRPQWCDDWNAPAAADTSSAASSSGSGNLTPAVAASTRRVTAHGMPSVSSSGGAGRTPAAAAAAAAAAPAARQRATLGVSSTSVSPAGCVSPAEGDSMGATPVAAVTPSSTPSAGGRPAGTAHKLPSTSQQQQQQQQQRVGFGCATTGPRLHNSVTTWVTRPARATAALMQHRYGSSSMEAPHPPRHGGPSGRGSSTRSSSSDEGGASWGRPLLTGPLPMISSARRAAMSSSGGHPAGGEPRSGGGEEEEGLAVLRASLQQLTALVDQKLQQQQQQQQQQQGGWQSGGPCSSQEALPGGRWGQAPQGLSSTSSGALSRQLSAALLGGGLSLQASEQLLTAGLGPSDLLFLQQLRASMRPSATDADGSCHGLLAGAGPSSSTHLAGAAAAIAAEEGDGVRDAGHRSGSSVPEGLEAPLQPVYGAVLVSGAPGTGVTAGGGAQVRRVSSDEEDDLVLLGDTFNSSRGGELAEVAQQLQAAAARDSSITGGTTLGGGSSVRASFSGASTYGSSMGAATQVHPGRISTGAIRHIGSSTGSSSRGSISGVGSTPPRASKDAGLLQQQQHGGSMHSGVSSRGSVRSGAGSLLRQSSSLPLFVAEGGSLSGLSTQTCGMLGGSLGSCSGGGSDVSSRDTPAAASPLEPLAEEVEHGGVRAAAAVMTTGASTGALVCAAVEVEEEEGLQSVQDEQAQLQAALRDAEQLWGRLQLLDQVV